MSASYKVEHDLHESDDGETTVLSDLFESLESADDLPAFGGPSESAFISKPEFEIEELMPGGPYTLRILGKIYDEVDRPLLMQLLQRGLLVGSEIWLAPNWIPFGDHPDFGAIQAHMSDELERVVERNRHPRELTPQPHWSTPEDIGKTDEVTQPHIHRDEIFGAQAGDIPPGLTRDECDDTRQTTEIESEPFREFAAELDSATARLDPQQIDNLRPGDDLNLLGAPVATDTSQPLELTDVADEEMIETTERDAPSHLLAAEQPTRERAKRERARQASPLEGSRSPATHFPTAVSGATQSEPVPQAAILKPGRKKRPTGVIPVAKPPEAQQAEPKTQNPLPGWVVFLAAVAITISVLSLAVLAVRTLSADTKPSPTAPTPAASAVTASVESVHQALPQAFSDGSDAAALAANVADEPGPHRTYVLESLHAARPTATSALEAARANLESGELATARKFAVDAAVLGAPVDESREIFEAALLRDESFRLPAAELISGDRVESTRLGEGSILVQLDGEEQARLYPALRNEPDAFRPQLSIVTLCQVIDCPFELAPTRRVLIQREALAGALVEEPGESELQLDDLRWSTSDDGEVVEGTLVFAPDSASNFPIADHDTWRPWLAAGELSAEDLQAMRDVFGAPAASPRELAGNVRPQLSALITIDFLVNNWGRLPEDASSTTMWRGDRIISARHDAAFATRSSKRVSGRFAWVEVFDRELIASIRLLSPDAIDPVLFDTNDPVSQARRDEFWKQREELLEVVEDAEIRHQDAIWL